MYFKMLHKLVDVDSTQFFCVASSNVTRGHPLKLVKLFSSNNSQLNRFKCRAINVWNKLDTSTVMCNNVKLFKIKLNLVDLNKLLNY